MIKSIEYQFTYGIRQKVMWPNEPIEFIQLENDPSGEHFGLFLDNELISVISIFDEEGHVQFRKFATLKEHQGKGYGTQLLTFVMKHIEMSGAQVIWCNARLEKAPYYERFGMEQTEKTFIRKSKSYVIMKKIIKNPT